MEVREIFPVVTSVSCDLNLDKFSFCAGGGSGDNLAESVESSFKEYGQSELNLNLYSCTYSSVLA